MKQYQDLLIGMLLSIAILSACSPINSVQPFDQQQAAVLLGEHRVANSAAW